MATRGGFRENSGRKSKAEEQRLIERLTPISDIAHTKFSEAVENGEQWAIKMFFEYFYGKPSQAVDVTSAGDHISPMPIITTLSHAELMDMLKQ